MPRLLWPSWRRMTIGGTRSWAISTAGAGRRRCGRSVAAHRGRTRTLVALSPRMCGRHAPHANELGDVRAASHPGSQHVDLAPGRGWVEAVLSQPADGDQASPRPPRADHVEVDVGAVAGDEVAKVLLVSERQGGEVVQAVATARLGPVDHAGDLVIVEEHMGDLQVAVRKHRCPRSERSLGNSAVARDQVGGKDTVRDQPFAFAVESGCDLLEVRTGPR